MRGIDVNDLCKRVDLRGSPLRMRGIGVAVFHVPLGFRITPAYAGNSPSTPLEPPSLWDHPCVCGE